MGAGNLLRLNVSFYLHRSELCSDGEWHSVGKVAKFKSRVGQAALRKTQKEDRRRSIVSSLAVVKRITE
jgi:hypothetical protein